MRLPRSGHIIGLYEKFEFLSSENSLFRTQEPIFFLFFFLLWRWQNQETSFFASCNIDFKVMQVWLSQFSFSLSAYNFMTVCLIYSVQIRSWPSSLQALRIKLTSLHIFEIEKCSLLRRLFLIVPSSFRKKRVENRFWGKCEFMLNCVGWGGPGGGGGGGGV